MAVPGLLSVVNFIEGDRFRLSRWQLARTPIGKVARGYFTATLRIGGFLGPYIESGHVVYSLAPCRGLGVGRGGMDI